VPVGALVVGAADIERPDGIVGRPNDEEALEPARPGAQRVGDGSRLGGAQVLAGPGLQLATTGGQIDLEQVLPLVVKKDDRREPFDRVKVLAGLRRACEKRPVSQESLDRLVDQLERELVETGEKEVPSAVIGEKVMGRLRELDQVAYVRFASVYRSFKDIHEFMAELSGLLGKPPGERA